MQWLELASKVQNSPSSPHFRVFYFTAILFPHCIALHIASYRSNAFHSFSLHFIGSLYRGGSINWELAAEPEKVSLSNLFIFLITGTSSFIVLIISILITIITTVLIYIFILSDWTTRARVELEVISDAGISCGPSYST